MRIILPKLGGVRHVTVRDVKLYVREGYIKGILKSSIMSDSTVEVRWRMCQCVLCLVTQIG